MDREFVQNHFGDQIDFGACYIGKNLNLQVLRGYARIDRLACVSAPDVFNQVDNPNGTQRLLNEAHARDCRTYAIEAEGMPPEESPRFFPEILLNARDTNVVELYNVEDPTDIYDFDSFSEDDDVPRPLVGLRVDLSAVDFPKQAKDPQISRVDGNHRLWGIDELLATAAGGDGATEDGADELPVVAFSLLVGLNANQEASLFRDINGISRTARLVSRPGGPSRLSSRSGHGRVSSSNSPTKRRGRPTPSGVDSRAHLRTVRGDRSQRRTTACA